MSRIITLLTDFGHKDSFVGIMKGVILGITPDARIVDLCHEIPSQDIDEASYQLTRSIPFFPQGTVHVAVVDPGVGGPRQPILVSARDQLFVAPDNGLLGPALVGEECRAYLLDRSQYWLSPLSHTFHGRDIFSPVAAHLARGVAPEDLGSPLEGFLRPVFDYPCREEQAIKGKIQHIDRFGNLISNILKNSLPKLPEDRFSVTLRGRRLKNFKSYYDEVRQGELVVLTDSFGFVEIACVRGIAEKVLGAKKGDEIIIEWNL